jgi:hypothetical protein
MCFVFLLLAGCGDDSQNRTAPNIPVPVFEARFVRTAFDGGGDGLFGVRDLDVDPSGRLYVLDSEGYRLYVLEDGRVLGSAGSRGEGPGEFAETPVYMDAGPNRVMITVGGARSSASIFTTSASYSEMFSAPSMVLQAVFAPDGGIVATTLDSPTVPMLFQRDGTPVRSLETKNEGDAIMDHFIMDAGAGPDGRNLLVVGYHFRNRIQVIDLATGALFAEFGLPGFPEKVDTKRNPSLDLFANGERPPGIPAELPQTTMIQGLAIRGGRIYVHVRDHAVHRGREIHVFTTSGRELETILLPKPAYTFAVASDDVIYATADTSTVVNMYELP